MLPRSEDIRDQILKWYKLTEVLHVLAPIFRGKGNAPRELLEWSYKTQTDSDHVEKCQGDRWRDLGERVAKQKKKNIWGKT